MAGETGPGATFDRRKIQDAIEAWRDGQTFDAIHPLEDVDPVTCSIFWDPDAVKDLARVIAATLDGRDVPSRPLPW